MHDTTDILDQVRRAAEALQRAQDLHRAATDPRLTRRLVVRIFALMQPRLSYQAPRHVKLMALAHEAGAHKGVVSKAIRQLETAGYLARGPVGEMGRQTYILLSSEIAGCPTATRRAA